MIVKRENGKLSPLNYNDTFKYGKRLAEVLLNYTWPTCIASELTKYDKDELLTSKKPYAEEIFVQNKINEIFGSDKIDFQVAFIPQCIFDAFSYETYLEKNDNLLNKAYCAWFDKIIRLESILSLDESAILIRKKINQYFTDINKHFYSGSYNAVIYMNNICTKILFDTYLDFKDSKSGIVLSSKIQMKSDELSNKLENITDYATNMDIVKEVIALEYQARINNNGLLFRGGGIVDSDISIHESLKKSKLAGTTWYQPSGHSSFLSDYAQGNDKKYSISFGNSLLAGIVNATGGCSLYYLNSSRSGYVLFIDKLNYVLDQNQRLFFISPLSYMASLFALDDEYFHSRSTVATLLPNKKDIRGGIQGFYRSLQIDSAGIFVITRDPLRHAELFSKFLASYGKMINVNSGNGLSSIEKYFSDKNHIYLKAKSAEIEIEKTIMKAQVNASKFYKNIRLVTPKLLKWIKSKLEIKSSSGLADQG